MHFFKTKTDTGFILHLTVVGFVLFGLSFLGYVFPVLNSLLFFVLVLFVAFLAVKRFELAVCAVFFELLIGVKGYLFSLSLFGFPVSLRLALFAAVFLAWLYFYVYKKKQVLFSYSKLFPLYAAFTLLLVLGMILGLAHGNSAQNLFFDVNGYFFYGLVFPLFAVLENKGFKKKIFMVFLAGALATTLFSLFAALQYTVFHQDSRPDLADAVSSELAIDDETAKEDGKISHSVTAKDELKDSYSVSRSFENKKPPIYRWTQDISIAEISYLAGPFFRVFSPGQVYTLFLLIVSLFLIAQPYLRSSVQFDWLPKLPRSFLWVLFSLSLVTLLLGFSRSLWIGMAFAFAIYLFYLKGRYALRFVLGGLVVFLVSFLLLYFFVPSAFELVSSRALSILQPSTESSGSNRLNVLGPAFDVIEMRPVWGSGFGTTVEYDSVVPEKFGTLRVFAFEWSYLDTVIEIGYVGLLVYLLFLFKTVNLLRKKQISFFVVSLLVLMIVNITTPYLNHPLGLGLVLLFVAFTHESEKKATS